MFGAEMSGGCRLCMYLGGYFNPLCTRMPSIPIDTVSNKMYLIQFLYFIPIIWVNSDIRTLIPDRIVCPKNRACKAAFQATPLFSALLQLAGFQCKASPALRQTVAPWDHNKASQYTSRNEKRKPTVWKILS